MAKAWFASQSMDVREGCGYLGKHGRWARFCRRRVPPVESRIGLKEGFGSTPGELGKLLTLSTTYCNPKKGR